MEKHNECGRSWTIVLAGGDGVRMREYVRGWSGAETPKQYCTFVGTRSLLQHTLDRTASLTPWKRIVIVTGRRHQEEAWKQLEHRTPGMTLLQPGNLDTAAGVFLALSYVLARDPEATVAVCPSDHFVFPEDASSSMSGRLWRLATGCWGVRSCWQRPRKAGNWSMAGSSRGGRLR